MKPEQLMIGDYILFNKEIYKIEEISKKGWVHITYNDESGCRVALSSDYILDEITPVPLTDEILKKNEFYYEQNVGDVLEYYNYEIIYDTWEHELRILENREQILKITTFSEMCVHELQHALRLCGIDKKIEI